MSQVSTTDPVAPLTVPAPQPTIDPKQPAKIEPKVPTLSLGTPPKEGVPAPVKLEPTKYVRPDKFKDKSEEDIIRAYEESEKHMGTKIEDYLKAHPEEIDRHIEKNKKVAPVPSLEPPKDAVSKSPQEIVKDIVSQVNVSIEQTGDIPPELFEKAIDLGFTANYLNSQVRQYQEQFSKFRENIAKEAGIKPVEVDPLLDAIKVKYANQPDTLKDYDILMKRGHYEWLKKEAIDLLDKGAFERKQGTLRPDLHGYKDHQEWIAALRHAKTNDERRKIQSKYENSWFYGQPWQEGSISSNKGKRKVSS